MPGRTRPSFGPGSRAGEHSARRTPGHKPIGVDIEFPFDFGSPNGFLCHKLIPAIDERTGQRLRCLPLLLGGLFKLATNRSPAEAFAAMADQRADDRLEMERLIRKHPLDAYRFNPHFPVNRLKIMRGAFGSPTCFVDGGIHFGKDRLREVEEPIVAAAVATKARMPQTPR